MTDDRDPFQAAFEDYQRAPDDTVRRRGMTYESLIDFDRRCGTGEIVRNGGAMTFDSGGNPKGMEATTEYRETVNEYVITRRLVDKLGLRPEQLKNAHIIENQEQCDG